MADGNRSAKGKQVAVDDYDEHGHGPAPDGGYGGAVGYWDGAATSGGGGTGSYYGGSSGGGASYGADWRGGGFGGMGFFPENPVGGGGGGSTLFPSTHIDAHMYAPQHYPGPLYWPAGNGVVGTASFPSPFTGAGGSGPQHAGTGYWPDSSDRGGSASFSLPFTGVGTHVPQHAGSSNWPGGNGGGGSASIPSPFTGAGTSGSGPQHAGSGNCPGGNGGAGSAPFPSPFTGAGVIGIPGPQHARTVNSWHTGAADHEFYYRGNGNGSGGATFPPPLNMGDGMYNAVPDAPNGGQPCSSSPFRSYMEQLDSDISRSLTSLSLRDRGSRARESLVARGRRHLSNLVNHGRQELQLINAGGDLRNAPFFPGPGRRGHGGDPYAGRRLDDVRGSMSGVARELAGCQFLVRMVAEGGAVAAGQVFDELAGEIVRLMADSVAHELVEKLAEYWTTDEQITRVLHVLAASPNQIVAAVARDHAG